MRIFIKHQANPFKIKDKLSQLFGNLSAADIPGGVKISDIKESWSENVMNVSFNIKRGFLMLEGSAAVTITEDTVVMELELPKVILKFVDEDEIAQLVKAEFTKLIK